MSVEEPQNYMEPLRKSVTVGKPVEQAFNLFTAGLARWWPLGRYSVSQERAITCVMEPRVDGSLYELRDDGERFLWGRVLVWDPPHRVVFSWHPGRDAETAQEVEIRFSAQGHSTRVDLEHRDWAKLGDRARETREGYERGWDVVLGQHFLGACRE